MKRLYFKLIFFCLFLSYCNGGVEHRRDNKPQIYQIKVSDWNTESLSFLPKENFKDSTNLSRIFNIALGLFQDKQVQKDFVLCSIDQKSEINYFDTIKHWFLHIPSSIKRGNFLVQQKDSNKFLVNYKDEINVNRGEYSIMFYELPEYYIGFAKFKHPNLEEKERLISGFIYINKSNLLPIFIVTERETNLGSNFKSLKSIFRIYYLNEFFFPTLSLNLFEKEILYASKLIYLDNPNNIYGEDIRAFPPHMGELDRIDSLTSICQLHNLFDARDCVQINNLILKYPFKNLPMWTAGGGVLSVNLIYNPEPYAFKFKK